MKTIEELTDEIIEVVLDATGLDYIADPVESAHLRAEIIEKIEEFVRQASP